MKLVYTDEAVEDLKRLRAFIAKHNPLSAQKIAKELVEKITLLPEFPKLGAPVALAPVPETIRDMVFGKYVVRYSVHSGVVIILRIWHGLEGER